MDAKSMPRRKVVDAYKPIEWGSLWRCKLSCGHWEVAYGRKAKGSVLPTAPNTVACRQCALRSEEVAHEK